MKCILGQLTMKRKLNHLFCGRKEFWNPIHRSTHLVVLGITAWLTLISIPGVDKHNSKWTVSKSEILLKLLNGSMFLMFSSVQCQVSSLAQFQNAVNTLRSFKPSKRQTQDTHPLDVKHMIRHCGCILWWYYRQWLAYVSATWAVHSLLQSWTWGTTLHALLWINLSQSWFSDIQQPKHSVQSSQKSWEDEKVQQNGKKTDFRNIKHVILIIVFQKNKNKKCKNKRMKNDQSWLHLNISFSDPTPGSDHPAVRSNR